MTDRVPQAAPRRLPETPEEIIAVFAAALGGFDAEASGVGLGAAARASGFELPSQTLLEETAEVNRMFNVEGQEAASAGQSLLDRLAGGPERRQGV